jgi:hypothetical protein
MLHLSISGLEKTVREIPRINRCQQASSERLGHQLGQVIRKTDAQIQFGDRFIRAGFSHRPGHLVVHGRVRFLSIISLGPPGLKNVAGRGREMGLGSPHYGRLQRPCAAKTTEEAVC